MANQVNLLNESHLNELKQLLELAASNSQENQAQVYRMISCIEHQPITYIYLSHILCSPQYPANLRQMAGLTMSSTLKRNLKSL